MGHRHGNRAQRVRRGCTVTALLCAVLAILALLGMTPGQPTIGTALYCETPDTCTES